MGPAAKVAVAVANRAFRRENVRGPEAPTSIIVATEYKDTLRFTGRIVQAPPALVDDVVAHELVQRLHRGHTPQFWATLGRVMPDYETLRARLLTLGPTLIW